MRVALVLFVLCGATTAVAVKVPTFYARQDYPGNGQVAVGDLNGDKIPDVISMFGYVINTLLGNGDGTFRVGPTTKPGIPINYFVTADLNGDGYADVVMSGGSGIAVALGNGDGTFQPLITYSGGGLTELVIGDFNGDGIPDVVGVGGGGIWLFTGKGGGVFNPGVLALTTAAGPSLVAADFNGDGKLDIAANIFSTFGAPTGFIVAFGNGDGTFQTPVIYWSLPLVNQYMAVGDVNLDGHPDIVIEPNSAGVGEAHIYLNNGSGGFTKSGEVNMLSTAGLTIGDVNGDGFPDLVNTVGDVAFGMGNGSFQPAVNYRIQSSGEGSFWGPALADLRGNGLTDMIFGDLSAISVLLSAGQGRFKDGIWTSVPGSGNCAATADFNRDGKPDLAVPTSQGIAILLGTGKATAPYSMGASIVVSGPGCPIAGDLNGDGIPDLLFGANCAGGVVAYLGNGDGTFTLAGTTVVGSGTLVLGDFNHDGKLDFADSSNQLALGNGDGTFQAPVAIVSDPPTEGYSWIAAGDVNNDGWIDLLFTNWNITRDLYVLLNNHRGGFGPVWIEPVRRAPLRTTRGR